MPSRNLTKHTTKPAYRLERCRSKSKSFNQLAGELQRTAKSAGEYAQSMEVTTSGPQNGQAHEKIHAFTFRNRKEISLMQRFAFAVVATLMAVTPAARAQGLLDTIRTPDKSVPVVNQTLSGTWLQELLLPGQVPGTGTLNLVTFQPDGTTVSIGSDGNRSPAFGLWVRVGDRKFLQTNFLFNFDPNRVLATVTKVRANAQLSPDGETMIMTAEIVVMDRAGKVMATTPGGTVRGVRLSLEIPGDFYDFQKLP